VLRIERDVVHALLDTPDTEHQARVEGWVEGCLDDMPELLRTGVQAESLLVAAWHRLRGTDLGTLLDAMERNPIGLVQQYPRLFRSLVLFGDLELAAPAR
jgi:hypothetical protein